MILNCMGSVTMIPTEKGGSLWLRLVSAGTNLSCLLMRDSPGCCVVEIIKTSDRRGANGGACSRRKIKQG